MSGELGAVRTHDPRLKRALLYQLSYELAECRYLKVNTGPSVKKRRLTVVQVVLDSNLGSRIHHPKYPLKRISPPDFPGQSCFAPFKMAFLDVFTPLNQIIQYMR